jgi:hypothetical protein
MSDPGELLRAANPVQSFTMESHRRNQMVTNILEDDTVSRSHSGRRRVAYAFAAGGVIVVCIALALLVAPTTRAPFHASLHLKAGQALSSNQEKKNIDSGGAPSLPGPVVPVSYVLNAGPELSASGGSSPAFGLSWPDDMTDSALRLAQVFGVGSTQPVPNGLIEGGVLVGAVDGPNVDVYPEDGSSQNGVLSWMYQDPSAPLSTTTPTGPQATAEALALLAKIGITQYLGTPQVSPHLNEQLAGDIGVAIDVVVDGDETPFYYVFVFGAGGSLVQSQGDLATLTSVGTFATISPTQAVGIAQGGTTYVPQGEAPTTCGVSGTPACQETVNSASIRYQTFDAADGSLYLLPTWQLVGESSTMGATQVGAWVSAIESQFVSLSAARAHAP